MTNTTKMHETYQHVCHLLHMAMQYPPWTIINLCIYAMAPNANIRRGSYASMWATIVCFYYALLLDHTWHKKIMERQRFSPLTFYTFDALVHWIPLIVLHVPYRGWMANATGLLNFIWGLLVTRGTMDLSDAYAPLTQSQWLKMWTMSLVITVAVPI